MKIAATTLTVLTLSLADQAHARVDGALDMLHGIDHFSWSRQRLSSSSASSNATAHDNTTATADLDATLDDNMRFVDNGIVRLGVDLSRGGSIGYFGPSGGSAANNIVNCHDMGREIQLSFYAGPKQYNPDNKCSTPGTPKWPWNPIGAGDLKGNRGTVNKCDISGGTSAHVVTTPLQWACDSVPCECKFEKKIQLGGPGNTGARIDAVLHNHRSDTTVYPPLNQELPAVYTNGEYYRLYTAQGGKVVE